MKKYINVTIDNDLDFWNPSWDSYKIGRGFGHIEHTEGFDDTTSYDSLCIHFCLVHNDAEDALHSENGTYKIFEVTRLVRPLELMVGYVSFCGATIPLYDNKKPFSFKNIVTLEM